MNIAFLGPRGTNSEEAALMMGAQDDDLRAYPGFPAIVSAITHDEVALGVLPVENSIEGPVTPALDLILANPDLSLVAEVVVPIQHMLIGVAGATLADLTEVRSHPQALAQSRAWLRSHAPHVTEQAALSTGGAVREVIAEGNPAHAAIGPRRAWELYGGELLAENLQENNANMTRFFAFGQEPVAPTGDDKTFIAFRTHKDIPGSLHAALAPLARAEVQLTNIITRPTRGWLGEYVFLLDLLGHKDDERIAAALDDMRAITQDVRVIGSCPRFPLETRA